MPPASYALRLDPFAAEYDPAIQLGEADEKAAPIDIRVEQAVWECVAPLRIPGPKRVYFVDGVRRVEHRLLVEGDERTLFGLLGSYGVGATCIERGAARVSHENVGRVCVVGGGALLPALTAPVAGGGVSITFEPRVAPENTPLATMNGLQMSMREGEASLAAHLGGDADLVLLDGPLTFLTSSQGPVVGFVKRLIRSYLGATEAGLLRRLAVGERTPLFLIQDAGAPRYSWYQRLAHGRAIESVLTGVVRLETSGSLALAEVRALADAAARLLPRFASDPAHDPRAPHNLHPIGGLEARLRRRLGDPVLIRRAIEAWLHREVLA